MKWYWWLTIAVVIIVIIALVVRSNKMKQDALNQIASNTTNVPKTFDPFDITQITRK